MKLDYAWRILDEEEGNILDKMHTNLCITNRTQDHDVEMDTLRRILIQIKEAKKILSR
jgi:hypothetical protein